jgi:peptide/nickel transport system permease protein
MGRYIIRRLIQAIFVILGVSFVSFMLLRINGNPVDLMLPPEATQEQRDAVSRSLGLEDPLIIQYLRFLSGIWRLDFGKSLFETRSGAMNLVLEALPATLLLAGAAFVISLLIAFPIGILSAVKRGSIFDKFGMVLAIVGQSIPVFWLGIIFISVFAVSFKWFRTSGYNGFDFAYLTLPAITLGLFSAARTTRLVRSGMIEVLNQEYIRTARAKGLVQWAIVRRHALKNAMIPIVTVLGLDFATLLGGAVVTESIFAWPGVGRLVVESISRRDFPVVQASVFLIALIYVLINLLVDVVYAYLNPRVRFS